MLFSEPKIPQSPTTLTFQQTPVEFQCSSASRKFLNALKRPLASHAARFQCSSASRKFLNLSALDLSDNLKRGFSALQRAENSSIDAARGASLRLASVSVLFSEPKIPQSLRRAGFSREQARFSALQRAENSSILLTRTRRVRFDAKFQCSSASRKFLNYRANRCSPRASSPVSVLFSEPKIPQSQTF